VRLFVAVWPDTLTRRTLASVPLEPTTELRLVRPEQWHVTLRFLGNVEPEIVPALLAGLESMAAGERSVLAHLGPHTAWLGRGAVLQVPVSGLDRLATAVRTATSELVPSPEPNEPAFTGHFTLARSKRSRGPDSQARAALAGIDVAGEFTVTELNLVASEPGPGGHRYRSLGSVSLGGGRTS
jgi:RNA 2',3'-cyclic 3'-phosphodiesterase